MDADYMFPSVTEDKLRAEVDEWKRKFLEHSKDYQTEIIALKSLVREMALVIDSTSAILNRPDVRKIVEE